MKTILWATSAVAALSCLAAIRAVELQAFRFVDPFIGTLNGGHVFAGASLPAGSIKPVADTSGADSGGNQGGFVSDNSPILGISQLHDDGTGGSPSLGQFKLLPQYCVFESAGRSDVPAACPLREAKRATAQVANSAFARPGTFGLQLQNGVDAEVTVTARTALHRFNYTRALHDKVANTGVTPISEAQRMSNSLGDSKGKGSLDIKLGNGTATVTGTARFLPSFGAGTYDVHFCATVPGVVSAGVWSNDTFSPGTYSLRDPINGTEAGALLKIDAGYLTSQGLSTLPVRIATSWKDAPTACATAASEMAEWLDVNSYGNYQSSAASQWQSVLSGSLLAETQGVSDDHKRLFYSSLYRAFLAPTNITADTPYATTGPEFDSLYCIWDSFRVVHPLYTLFKPSLQAEIIQGVMNIYRRNGFLPDCHMSLCKGFTQGGSNADSMLSDSYVKGIRARGIDWDEVLKAMIKDAEVDPPDWGVEGRGGIAARKRLGYVPRDADGNAPAGANVINGRSVSRTLEYAFNDLGIALVGAGQGRSDVYDDYVRRSLDGFHLWNDNVTSDGYRGFMDSRYADGRFSMAEDPRRCSPAYHFGECYLSAYPTDVPQFYEASSWEYSFFVLHDMAGVVRRMGGDETFISRLDHAWQSGYNDVGDEQGFLPNYLYNYARGGYPHTVDRVLSTLQRYFNTTTAGLPGNDDSGAEGAFVVWATLGLFPVAGTSVYLLSTPLLPQYQVVSGVTDKRATVRAVNFDGASHNKYIVGAKLNGRDFTRNWVTHQELFLEGGTLELQLGSRPSAFGTRAEDLPPSLSTGGFKQHAAQGY